ncbi:DUF2878 domain-containing protein [Paraburkholderia sp. BCC1886]|uniref:DUF2878 domain-containing protein n=1 Tax=Paraburkholderia sp. BCC1886 TaxID=2562670 RepID=UPI0011840AAA|nr:DUF2878 domain-containing protein [Paraburkholderia sp. BCC1886]
MRAPHGHRFETGLYFVVCQAGWFVCVLGGAHRAGWLGVLFAACALAWHLTRVPAPRREARLVAVTVAIGLAWESLVVDAGLLSYPSGAWINGLAPYWLCALWALFAIQFNVVYAWLRGHVVWAALLGAIAGPLSFRAGAALGAVHVERPVAAWVTLSIGWAVLLPGLLRLAQHWDGVATPATPTSQAPSPTSPH